MYIPKDRQTHSLYDFLFSKIKLREEKERMETRE